MITSASNGLIKHIKKLQAKKSYRAECGEFIIEGLRQVFDGAAFCSQVIVSEDFLHDLPDFSCPVETVSTSLFSTLSETKSPQGILAIAKMNLRDEKSLIKENGLYL